MKRVTVVYNRDRDGWWVAHVPAVRGCHSQGRTIDEARRRVVEAMALFDTSVGPDGIVDRVRMPAAARRAIAGYRRARRKADEQSRRAASAARQAVAALTQGDLKLSARDASRLLGLSHQRVHQLGR